MINFYGKAIYILTKQPPKEFLDELEKIIEEINSKVLTKGAKRIEEASKIANWSIEDNKLVFEIISGSKVRVHVAALRAKNFLAPLLGKKFRIGIKDIILKDAKIELDREIRVSKKLPFVKDVIFEDGKTIILLQELNESLMQKQIIDRLLQLIEYKERRAKWGGKVEHWVLIKQSNRKEITYKEDPNEILEKAGFIKRFAPGQWLYTPPIAHLLRELQRLFIEKVLKPLGFVEAIFPKLVPLEVGLKTGHVKGTPHQMFFASQPISYNLDDFEEWIDTVMVLNKAPPEKLRDFVKPPSYFLCFAQCEPFYWFFGGEIIDEKNLPVKWFDYSGPSFRWESGGLRGIERLVEFHRIEVVWMGEPDQVVEIRNQLLDRYEYFMDKVLDLEWRWAWVTPFYLEHAGEARDIKEVGELDINQPGTIDFEAWLPYKGPRDDKDSWLEIGNISIHGTKYTSSFKIKHNKRNKIIWTGCSGFGTQRWLLAFLAQKGFDPDNWPKEVAKNFRKPPEGFITVTYPKTAEGKELYREILSMLSKLS